MSSLTTTPDPTAQPPATTAELPAEALHDLARAAQTLERPSLAIRFAAMAGAPIEALKARLPATVQQMIDGAVRRALKTAVQTALVSGPGRAGWARSGWLHRGLTVATGVAGGAFGLPGTLAELPVSTTLLLRQIAAIAAEEGEDLSNPATAAECLEVFAIGSREPDVAPERTDYFTTRMALAEALRAAVSRGAAGIMMPGFIGTIAARFGGPVALKLSAQAAPVVGAAAGAAVNLVFLEHFRDVARAHFTVRRLERQHGAAAVRQAYRAVMPPKDAG